MRIRNPQTENKIWKLQEIIPFREHRNVSNIKI